VTQYIRAKCLECNKIIISKSHYDFVSCGCPNNSFVDGGGEIGSRYGGKDMSKIRILENK